MMIRLLATFALVLIAFPALSYQLLLDIDLDDDPTTINTVSIADSIIVRLVLAPDYPWIPENLTMISFGLGGTCWDCNSSEYTGSTYGTDCDLFHVNWDDPWLGHELFTNSTIDMATCMNCCGNPGFHYIFNAEAAGGGLLLQEAFFLTDFMAWVSCGWIFDYCPHPTSDLATFPAWDGQCHGTNTIQIGDEFIGVEGRSWSALKALY